MQFTESEMEFLLQPHQEKAAGVRKLEASVDLRSLGCPADVFERILESRAKKLGREFAEFRLNNRSETTAQPSLEAQIRAEKLF